MKQALVLIVFIFTCFYFFAGSSLALFTKLGKNVQTELFDMDEDTPDSEGKEAKDFKEDGCDEEDFIEILRAAITPDHSILSAHNFRDPHLFISSHVLEKTSPPPRA
jgi:hypothetical protein